MLRIIAGIIVGYVVMAILVIATFFITIAAMGWDGVLQPGSYWTTNTFNMIVLTGGFTAAIVGGAVCMLIARNSKATFVLVAIVLALGIGGAVMNMNRPEPPARTTPPSEISLEDLNAHGKEPTWFAFGKVVIAAAGLLIGSSLVSRKNAARQSVTTHG
jgi:ABC-type transport system involved in multi-copper enzyme maturation permease subunit